MSGRFARDRRLPNGLTRSAQVAKLEAALAALLPTHDYDSSNYTLSGANLSTIPNRGSAGGQMTVVAGTIAEPSADSALLGEKSWIAPGGQTIQSSLAASAFKFLHDGTGCHTFCVYVPTVAATRGVWATRSFAGTEVGAGVFYQSTSSFNCQTANGTANLYIHAGANGSTPINTGALLEHSYLEGAPTEAFTYRNGGALINSGNTAAAPSAADPTSTLRMGDSAGSSVSGQGRYARWIGFARVLSASEQATVRSLLTTRYGV